jgi:hypothetical protein
MGGYYTGYADHERLKSNELSVAEGPGSLSASVDALRFLQSDRMSDALKRAGKHVDFVTLKHEDHWLSRSETRLQMLEATIAFLKANNPPDQRRGGSVRGVESVLG